MKQVEIAEIEIPVATVMQSVTLRVTGTCGYRWRVWIASKLIVAAAIVLRCNHDICIEHDSTVTD